MTSLEAITIVVEPPRVEAPPGAEGQWTKEMARYDHFAEALRAHTSARVDVVRAFLRDAPGGALVVRSTGYEAMMDEVVVEERAAVAARSLLLDIDRSTVLSVLERHGFAGGIDRNRWFEWRSQRDRETGGGLYGRRDLAPSIGGRCVGPPSFQGARYCVLGSDRFADLPSLVVGYLAECMHAPLVPGVESSEP